MTTVAPLVSFDGDVRPNAGFCCSTRSVSRDRSFLLETKGEFVREGPIERKRYFERQNVSNLPRNTTNTVKRESAKRLGYRTLTRQFFRVSLGNFLTLRLPRQEEQRIEQLMFYSTPAKCQNRDKS